MLHTQSGHRCSIFVDLTMSNGMLMFKKCLCYAGSWCTCAVWTGITGCGVDVEIIEI